MINRYLICVGMYILSQIFKIGYKMAVSFLIKHCIDEIRFFMFLVLLSSFDSYN